MTPAGTSHKHDLPPNPQPGAKLGEADCEARVRLDVRGAKVQTDSALPQQEATQLFAEFWQRIEQEWAERFKFDEFYGCGEQCYYDFADECVEPSLRNMNCCFECWLFQELDEESRKQAKQEEASR
jgi:hypothetical protein